MKTKTVKVQRTPGDRWVWGVLLALLLLGGFSVGAAAQDASSPTAEEIIAEVDANMYLGSAHMVARMIIETPRRKLEKEMEAWVEGDSRALVEFLNPADRGTKYLKLDDELWMFFPDAEDLVKISGHMLSQGFMGSDFSYEDALASEKLSELYRLEYAGTETCSAGTCHVIEAQALPGKEVSYARRRMWVAVDKGVVVREELYAASGKLLKVARADDIREIDGRWYPKRTTMEDKLRRGSKTEFIVETLEFDVDIPEETFSLRSLMR